MPAPCHGLAVWLLLPSRLTQRQQPQQQAATHRTRRRHAALNGPGWRAGRGKDSWREWEPRSLAGAEGRMLGKGRQGDGSQ